MEGTENPLLMTNKKKAGFSPAFLQAILDGVHQPPDVSFAPPVEPVPLVVPVELPVLEGVEPKVLLEPDEELPLEAGVVEGVELDDVDVPELPKLLVVEEPPVVPDAGVVDGELLLSNDDEPVVPDVDVLPNELEPEDGVVEKELSVELDDPKPEEDCDGLDDVEPAAL
jgi:hypothetical protein